MRLAYGERGQPWTGHIGAFDRLAAQGFAVWARLGSCRRPGAYRSRAMAAADGRGAGLLLAANETTEPEVPNTPAPRGGSRGDEAVAGFRPTHSDTLSRENRNAR